MKREAVITGVGIVCALGKNKEEFWHNACLGQCGIEEVDLFDTARYRTHTGAQIRDFFPEDHFSRRLRARMSRCDQIGLLAARESLRDAGLILADENKERIAVVLGAGAGGMISAEKYRRRQIMQPHRLPPPSLLVSFEASVLTDYVGSEFGITGPRLTVVTACSSSATAIGYGLDLIRGDEADVVIAGGSESLCELTYGGFNSLRSVDPNPCKPFDLNRKGLSLGEGAGMLIIEEKERARARKARIYAQLLSYALSSDAYHMTAPDPAASGAKNAMKWALKRAGLTPPQIDYISAHGTATKHNDVTECKAISDIFGAEAPQIPVSSLKSMLGHCLGAAGSVEAVGLVLTIFHSLLLPTINYTTPDPQCQLDFVPDQARPASVHYGLSNSFAFGGNNTALIMGAHHE
ncbi:beta-ketoacyl-[acyl-carrier-protein] synthase family protein [candidate division CSSED10-310 bacterium]|uniref:Beta-ketoacyl-[acyl-carrier-protein] synthase family protein n=1 Tax=candidate division CSSED10-310 bacterium TaxID=2855610 RepID=A0ABV6Z2R1_UNCC1